jgi:hypothetical protein
MGNPLTSPAFVKALQEDIREIREDALTYNNLNSKKEQIFDVITDSTRAWEEFATVSALGDIPAFNGRLTTLGLQMGFSTRIEPAEFAAKVVMERKLFDDLQYDILMKRAKELVTSALRVRDKNAVKIFGNATSTAFDFMPLQEEGQALASTAHTTRVSGVSTTTGFSNLGTSALNAVSVAATRILMRKFKQANGERIDVGDSFALLVPDDLFFKASEINKTVLEVDSANNNVNMQKGLYTIINWLRLSDHSTTSWGMLDMSTMKDNFKWIQRANAETSQTIDFNTFSMEDSVYERHAGGFIDWRSYHHQNVT